MYGYTTILAVSYTFLSQTASSPFNCAKQPSSTTWVVREAPSVECYTGSWVVAAPFAVVFMAIYMFGIPASFAYLLWKKTKQGVIETPEFQYRWGSLTLPYRQQYYWYVTHPPTCAILSLSDGCHGHDAS